MLTFEELLEGQSGADPETAETGQPFNIDKSVTLKKDDLLKYQHLQPIKQYMIERKGVDYKDKPDEQVVDDFVKHMRYFDTTLVLK